jgi:cellulose synthase/poly-beta-1,6-N-acetylglucosamine synthase-like glycosyltransferase
MTAIGISVILALLGAWLVLAPASDALAYAAGLVRRQRHRNPPSDPTAALLFLVPAHNEELLIARCVDSLCAMRYPPALRRVVVIADNCTDQTAALARQHGARVLERVSADNRGKGHAIGWSLQQLELGDVAAVVIVDADTIVEPDYAAAIAAQGPLEDAALQTYDGLSNEFENALTRMAGLLTRNRYGTSLRLKARAGLNCPLTGDGVVLGTQLLSRFPWQVATITEGWELYARLTVAGQTVSYAPEARLYAQEANSLASSRTQRQRWAAGRLAVLRAYLRSILTSPKIRLLQRLDLVAELSNLGPVTHCTLGAAGVLIAIVMRPPFFTYLTAILATPIVHQTALSALSLRRHPEPLGTVAAFASLPRYVLWRLGVAVGVLGGRRPQAWVRTKRH